MPIIVLHAKAGSDAASYARRLSAAAALKEWLDRIYPLRAVWVIGDFNDDVDVSITTPQPTPYAAFVQDVARWRFPTKQLSDARIASTVSFPDLIDHQLVSAVAGLRVIDRSIRAWRLDSLIPSYRTTTTDHYPVVAGYMPK
jgi:hypothetical protein